MPAVGVASVVGKRERFADRRLARYDKTGLGHAQAIPRTDTELVCVGCGKGVLAVIATIAGREMYECAYCNRRCFLHRGPRP
jgi:DNA-directed RNA polymerase subunit RPC12/RpoP